jgi:uncharacterized protein YceK
MALKRLILAVVLSGVGSTMGCGTVVGMTNPEWLEREKSLDTANKAYIGVRVDAWAIPMAWHTFMDPGPSRFLPLDLAVLIPTVAVLGADLCVSAAADTLLLPYTLATQRSQATTGDRPSPPGRDGAAQPRAGDSK